MSYLTEAFRQLNLTEAAFLADDEEDVLGAKDLLNKEKNSDMVVYDTDAVDEEDIKDSYIGNVILECSVCHKLLFKEPDEVILPDGMEEEDLEDDTLVNESEECPICLSTDGFYIRGEIKPFHSFNIEYEVEEEDEEDFEEDEEDFEEDEEDFEEDEEEDSTDNKKEESLRRSLNKRSIFESKTGRSSSHNSLNESKANLDALRSQLASMLEDPNDIVNRLSARLHGNQENESLEEGFNNVDVSTDTERLTMQQDENQKVTITTEPIGGGSFPDDMSNGDEFISPLSDDTFDEIQDANTEDADTDLGGDFGDQEFDLDGEEDLATEEGGEEGAPELDLGREDENIDMTAETDEVAPEEETESDVEINDIKEESFNRLGTSYLKNTYDNVVSFNTTGAKINGNKLILEGMILFDSGNRKATKFIFESHDITKRGKLRFIGENADITRGKKAFGLVASLKNGSLLTESLKYDYRQGKTRIKGREVL